MQDFLTSPSIEIIKDLNHSPRFIKMNEEKEKKRYSCNRITD